MTTVYHPESDLPSALWTHRPTLRPLREAATSVGIDFGMAFKRSQLVASTKLADLVIRECAIAVDETSLTWAQVESSQGSFSFTNADVFAAWCLAHGIEQVQGGHLIWHDAAFLPSWLTAITNVANSRAATENHITTLMQHMTACDHWNVVNEVINGDDATTGYRNTYWWQIHGTDFPVWAFQAARAARPDATLIWNNNHIEDSGAYGTAIRAQVLAALTAAINAGAPIDGFGTQMHLPGFADAASPSVVTTFLNAVAALGLDIYITELDVSDQTFSLATREQSLHDYTFNYVGAVCRDVPALRHIVVWDVMDHYSWLNAASPRADGYGVSVVPFDRQGYPKLMAQALLDSFALRRTA